MAGLKDKVENALNEARILILAGQVVIGADLRIFFESGYDKLPRSSQVLMTALLGLMLAGLGFLLMPAAFHRISERGMITERLQPVTSAAVGIALLPFAFGLAGSLYVAAQPTAGTMPAVVMGMLTSLLALALWYGVEIAVRARHSRRLEPKSALWPSGKNMDQSPKEATTLSEKIKQVLMEHRMVLPGVQALLAFQLICVFAQSFDEIPMAAKSLHLGSLSAVAVCAVLLIMPAAYHRIVEQGEDSEQFHRLASTLLLWAMSFLALGVAGDFAVILKKVTDSWTIAGAASSALVLLCAALWFAYPIWKREHQEDTGEKARAA